MKIFSIETSCDETALAFLNVTKRGMVLEKNVVSSQVATHRKYGGIVPEVAARMHTETLPRLLDSFGKKSIESADLIAVTSGPGLITSLMIGVQAAKTLAHAFKKPLVGVNHLEGHIYANWLSAPDLLLHPQKYFPALALVVSGGHTEFILMKGLGEYKLIGQTHDDAAGESFDKVAKILNIGYPGGPVISKYALQGNPKAIQFPRPMIGSKDYNVSFSGLKTAVLYYLQKRKSIKKSEIPDIAASFQQAVVDVLISKLRKAMREYRPHSLLLGGGVAANALLRTEFQKVGSVANIPVFVPDLKFTGDNAAMIAVTGYYRRAEASRAAWKTLAFNPQLPFAV